jgi:hypothetical protein
MNYERVARFLAQCAPPDFRRPMRARALCGFYHVEAHNIASALNKMSASGSNAQYRPLNPDRPAFQYQCPAPRDTQVGGVSGRRKFSAI